jgi:hypothetical protein
MLIINIMNNEINEGTRKNGQRWTIQLGNVSRIVYI